MKSFELAELPERWLIVPPEQLSDEALVAFYKSISVARVPITVCVRLLLMLN